jgi:hypothetical protein
LTNPDPADYERRIPSPRSERRCPHMASKLNLALVVSLAFVLAGLVGSSGWGP